MMRALASSMLIVSHLLVFGLASGGACADEGEGHCAKQTLGASMLQVDLSAKTAKLALEEEGDSHHHTTTPTCTDISGRFLRNDATPFTISQTGCSAVGDGAGSYTFTLTPELDKKGRDVVCADTGNCGVISGAGSKLTITWGNHVVYTKTCTDISGQYLHSHNPTPFTISQTSCSAVGDGAGSYTFTLTPELDKKGRDVVCAGTGNCGVISGTGSTLTITWGNHVVYTKQTCTDISGQYLHSRNPTPFTISQTGCSAVGDGAGSYTFTLTPELDKKGRDVVCADTGNCGVISGTGSTVTITWGNHVVYTKQIEGDEPPPTCGTWGKVSCGSKTPFNFPKKWESVMPITVKTWANMQYATDINLEQCKQVCDESNRCGKMAALPCDWYHQSNFETCIGVKYAPLHKWCWLLSNHGQTGGNACHGWEEYHYVNDFRNKGLPMCNMMEPEQLGYNGHWGTSPPGFDFSPGDKPRWDVAETVL